MSAWSKVSKTPPLDVPLSVKGSDFMGDWEETMIAKPYKEKQKNGRTWRWVRLDGTLVSHKDRPEFWRTK